MLRQKLSPAVPQSESRQQDAYWQQEQLKNEDYLQQQALQQAREELLALPAGLLAQLLAQSPHLYVEPHTLRGREGLQWQLRQLALLPPTNMLASVREGVAYHHAGRLPFSRRTCWKNQGQQLRALQLLSAGLHLQPCHLFLHFHLCLAPSHYCSGDRTYGWPECVFLPAGWLFVCVLMRH